MSFIPHFRVTPESSLETVKRAFSTTASKSNGDASSVFLQEMYGKKKKSKVSLASPLLADRATQFFEYKTSHVVLVINVQARHSEMLR